MSDYISREAAIDLFQRLAYDDWNQGANTTWANAYSEAAEMIAQLPAADVVEVRHGRWLPVDDKMDAFDCSECDAMVSKRMNYCPNCGAKMKGEK